jgi:hypothetical protein
VTTIDPLVNTTHIAAGSTAAQYAAIVAPVGHEVLGVEPGRACGAQTEDGLDR